jgi:type IV pilus assembly protein PilE
MRSQNGFTLIELMIVVGIIAILTSIVLPTYKDYVVRGKIPDATSNLAAKRIAMEQYFQDNRRYSTIAGGAICGGSNPTSSNNSSPTFTFSCVAIHCDRDRRQYHEWVYLHD